MRWQANAHQRNLESNQGFGLSKRQGEAEMTFGAIWGWLSHNENREILAWIGGGVVSGCSMAYGIYQRHSSIRKATEESNKVQAQAQKLSDIETFLGGLFRDVDEIVQRPKHRKVTIEEMQDMARGARSQIFALANLVSGQKAQLEEWRCDLTIDRDRT